MELWFLRGWAEWTSRRVRGMKREGGRSMTGWVGKEQDDIGTEYDKEITIFGKYISYITDQQYAGIQKVCTGRTDSIGLIIFRRTNWDSRLSKNFIFCPMSWTILQFILWVSHIVYGSSLGKNIVIFHLTNHTLSEKLIYKNTQKFNNLSNQSDNVSYFSHELATLSMVPGSVNMLSYFN